MRPFILSREFPAHTNGFRAVCEHKSHGWNTSKVYHEADRHLTLNFYGATRGTVVLTKIMKKNLRCTRDPYPEVDGVCLDLLRYVDACTFRKIKNSICQRFRSRRAECQQT